MARGPGPRAKGPDQVSSTTVLLAPPIPRPNQGWGQELQGKGRSGVGGERGLVALATRLGSLTYYGHLSDEDLRIEFATLRNETKRRVGTAASTGRARAPPRPKRKPVLKRHDVPQAGTPALQNRQPLPQQSYARSVGCVLDDELDILVGELRDPHCGLVGVRHRAPPLARPLLSALPGLRQLPPAEVRQRGSPSARTGAHSAACCSEA